ncbi:hypothetical protein SO802_020578 [Lithocarpus litseifolius]|uniref:Sodium/calcium exchanger membrane region domain-containing protein n=1 Tax=Lithocarpus litseifolius TaxID=425828 RepID=A0AAW2CCS5_9ROSI
MLVLLTLALSTELAWRVIINVTVAAGSLGYVGFISKDNQLGKSEDMLILGRLISAIGMTIVPCSTEVIGQGWGARVRDTGGEAEDQQSPLLRSCSSPEEPLERTEKDAKIFCILFIQMNVDRCLELAFYTGPTELIISILALKSGMIRAVQLSLLGSILSNLLLTTAVVNSGLLFMAVMGLLFPAVLHYTHTEVYFGKSELALSRFSSCIMLVTYAAYFFFQLKNQRNLNVPLNEEGTSHYFKGLMLLLCYLIVAASFFVHVHVSPGGQL